MTALFRWTGQREEAAVLVTEDRLTNEEIAARVGVSRQALDKCKRHPEFARRVESLVAAMAEAVRARGIASRERRVEALNDRWRRMLGVIEARAKEMADVAGGDTGLLVRQVKLIKVYVSVGDDEGGRCGGKPAGLSKSSRAVEVAEFAVDVGLLRELREHEKQAAQEMGQWAKPEQPADAWSVAVEEALEELGGAVGLLAESVEVREARQMSDEVEGYGATEEPRVAQGRSSQAPG